MSKTDIAVMNVPPLVQSPTLDIPSGSCVQVSVINTTSSIGNVPIHRLLAPPMHGFTHIKIPCYSFLIEHSSGRKVLFDLGVRRDLDGLPQSIKEEVLKHDFIVEVERGVDEILEENGIRNEEIEAIIWRLVSPNHHHWDHTGDPSRFPSSTDLIVGPGFKKAFIPGYPESQSSGISTSAYSHRNFVEIDFSKEGKRLQIGRFEAVDYFEDGSFYILDAPGHSIGHICGLARTTTSTTAADTLILMGADSCHHGGEFRPSPYLPLPGYSSPAPAEHRASHSCFGSVLEDFLKQRGKKVTEPFFHVDGEVAQDVFETAKTIEKVQEADASENIFVIMAHDGTLLDLVDFFPAKANNWKGRGWAEKSKWAFLKDFESAIQLMR